MDYRLQLAASVNDRLKASGKPTIAVAESLSGGGVASALTAHSGSSAWFLGGIVAYVNEAKASLLGVDPQILERLGAVSAECAIAMAEGARKAFGSDISVATTGIAGPTGATARKPVGLVFTALANQSGSVVLEHRFDGDRATITSAAVDAALEMLIAELDRQDASQPV